jgi:hypothetical protein
VCLAGIGAVEFGRKVAWAVAAEAPALPLLTVEQSCPWSPPFKQSPLQTPVGVGFSPFRAVCSRPIRPCKGSLCSLPRLGFVAA